MIGKLICKIKGKHTFEDKIKIQKHEVQWYLHHNQVCKWCGKIIYVDQYVSYDEGNTWKILKGEN
jgi:hypothetical protein